ncbi:nitrous oxide-stimulated promoter family protein [Anaerosinus massiliensis]|uniref:nitrous oxide-stimulated promoter family protein n=1 Tax=Massilibacillus massiliensis TaxID=1806837 RepID=UPI000DA5FAE9|nr:nitrous oxide-stimulated promoter family protein [Massilibacillus massiliensis]
MGIFSKFFAKKQAQQAVIPKDIIPKEKETVRKAFGIYCHSKHGTSSNGKKLCPKCTALLATVMLKMNRCPYGFTKPICEKCKTPCFGTAQTKEFLVIMSGAKTKMFFKHPIMTMKHMLYGMRKEAKKDDKKDTKKNKK